MRLRFFIMGWFISNIRMKVQRLHIEVFICNGTLEIVADRDLFKAILTFRKYSYCD